MGVLVEDNFIESVDTALGSHTPDIAGTGWTQEFGPQGVDVDGAGDYILVAAATQSGKEGYSSQPNPTDKEHDIEVEFQQVATGTDDPFGLVGRWVDNSNHYRTWYEAAAGTRFQLDKRVLAVTTNLATDTTNTLSANDKLKLEIRDAAKKVYLDTGTGYVEIMSSTDDDHTSVGKTLIVWGNLFGSSVRDTARQWHITWYKATEGAVVTLQPTGIASAEAFGTAAIDLNVTPSAIAPDEAFGSAAIGLNVQPSAIPSVEAFGSPAIDILLQPTGIPSAEAFGDAVVDSGKVLPTGITSAEAFGTPGIDLNVQPSAISSQEAFGTPSIGLNVAPSAIAPDEAFGTPSIDIVLQPTGIPSAEAFGSPILPTKVFPTGIPSLEAFGNPSITNRFFNFKWSLRDVETSSELWEARILEPPTFEKTRTNPLFGVSGFGETTLIVDNHDGALNTVPFQGGNAKIWAGLDEGGEIRTLFAELDASPITSPDPVSGLSVQFEGVITARTLGWQTEIRIEDLNQKIFEEVVPKRTVTEATVGVSQFASARDKGARIPVVMGRAIKLPLTHINADPTAREWDFLIGEGAGLAGAGMSQVYTVYKDDQALKDIEGNISAGTLTTITIEAADRRPFDDWYKWFWVEILDAGTGAVLNATPLHCIGYDQSTNILTLDQAHGVSSITTRKYRLREWHFYDGTQVSPYSGLAVLRLKKPFGTDTRIPNMYADVEGFATEKNPVRFIESILTNSTWGLGLSIDQTSFDNATALSDITALKAEGAINQETRAFEVIEEVLSYRGMTLVPGATLGIKVDAAKTPIATFGAGDGFWENIIEVGGLEQTDLDQLAKTLKGRYRMEYKKGDFSESLDRSVHIMGNEVETPLPFVFDPVTADRVLDFRADRQKSFNDVLRIIVGMDGKDVAKGDAVTVLIPSLGIQGDWEVIESRRNFANFELTLMKYRAETYTYEATGGLPTDPTGIDADLSLTFPDPVSGLSANGGFSGNEAFIDLSWTLPEDVATRARVYWKQSGATSAEWHDAGTGKTTFTIAGLTVGETYDVQVVAEGPTGLQGVAIQQLNILTPGDTTAPAKPTGLAGSAEFATLKWDANSNSESDFAGWEIQIYSASSGGVQLFPSSGFFFIAGKKGDRFHFDWPGLIDGLTGSTIRGWARIRAVDKSGNTSAWTSRVQAQSTAIGKPPVAGSFDNNTAVVTNSNTEFLVATLTLTSTGNEVYIWTSFMFEVLAGSIAVTPIRLECRLKRVTGGTPTTISTFFTPFQVKDRHSIAFEEFFESPSGTVETPVTHTYELYVVGVNPALGWNTQATNRRMIVQDIRL